MGNLFGGYVCKAARAPRAGAHRASAGTGVRGWGGGRGLLQHVHALTCLSAPGQDSGACTPPAAPATGGACWRGTRQLSPRPITARAHNRVWTKPQSKAA